MKYLDMVNNFLNKVLLFLGGIAVLILMLLATGNVVMRIFHMPFRGTYEIVSFMGAVVIAFALGYTQKRKDHIVVDILSETFSPGVKRVVDSVSYFVTMIFFAIISWVICRWGLRIAASGEVSETLKIAYYPFILCVALGFAFLCLTLIMDFLNALLKKGGNPAS